MRTPLKVLLVLGVGVVVLVGVVLAVLWGTSTDGRDDARRTKGITVKQFRSVRPGASEAEVEARFGRAADRDDQEVEATDDQEAETYSCLYYPERRKKLDEGRSFQFCFVEGRLDTKDIH